MEIWDVYDRDRQLTPHKMMRGDEFAENAYHLVVHICIFNAKDQLLIQQRQPFKEGWPGKWDLTVGGSAVSGDNSSKAAERELFEEIGYRADLSGVRPVLTMNFGKGFDDYYVMQEDVDLSTLTLQYEEVQAVKWASLDDVMQLLYDGDFVPHNSNLIALLFHIGTGSGIYSL